MLTANRIKEKIADGSIVITPFNEERLNPNSYNITLHNKLLIYDEKILDIKKLNKTRTVIIPNEGLVLQPNKLYLGRTVEYTETHDCIPCIDGRSSIGRLGLNIEISAGFGDIGFCGTWTLEIRCVEPVKIYPFIEIGQIYYFEPDGYIDRKYSGKYQKQDGITASRMWKDIERK